MPQQPLPTEKEVTSWIRERRNWAAGARTTRRDDQPHHARQARGGRAARQSGRSVSLSRPFPKEPGPNTRCPRSTS